MRSRHVPGPADHGPGADSRSQHSERVAGEADQALGVKPDNHPAPARPAGFRRTEIGEIAERCAGIVHPGTLDLDHHPHYLRGTVHCGRCEGRRIVSANKNPYGTEYRYFVCVGRHQKRTTCDQSYMFIETVEALVEDYYATIGLTPDGSAALRNTSTTGSAADAPTQNPNGDANTPRSPNSTTSAAISSRPTTTTPPDSTCSAPKAGGRAGWQRGRRGGSSGRRSELA